MANWNNFNPFANHNNNSERNTIMNDRYFDNSLDVSNPAPRCPVVLLLDVSISMDGEPIRELNQGYRQFLQETMNDEGASMSVDLEVITFGSSVEVRQPFMPLSSVAPAPAALTAGGSTPMGQALRLASEHLKARRQKYRENGIAAYGVIMYLSFTFVAVFIGYSVSTAPVIGFHYGAGNKGELNNLLRKSAVITLSLGGVMTAFALVFSGALASVFVGYDAALTAMTTEGLRIFSLSFVFSGFSIFGSSFFTALNNGPVSALISFMRTLVYQALGVILLPIFFDIDGIWYSMLVAEILAISTTLICIYALKNRYGYLKSSQK